MWAKHDSEGGERSELYHKVGKMQSFEARRVENGHSGPHGRNEECNAASA